MLARFPLQVIYIDVPYGNAHYADNCRGKYRDGNKHALYMFADCFHDTAC